MDTPELRKEGSFRKLSKQFNIARRIYQQQALNELAQYHIPQLSLKTKCKKFIKSIGITECLLNTLQIVKWLPHYKVKEYLVDDIIAGCTSSVMHIPQGMAYALLMGTPPVVGLYMAFFPVIIYVLVGKCPDVSIGTFAVTCLMAGKVAHNYAEIANEDSDAPIYTPIQIICALSFYVGVFQLIMWVFRMGAVSALLSDPLVSGFTTGTSFQVMASQLKSMFGIILPPPPAYFNILFTLFYIFKNIVNTNMVTFAISITTCILLYINNNFLKERLKKRCRFPLPAELIFVVAGTAVSHIFELHENHNVRIVGPVPSGLPEPQVPPLEIFEVIFLDVFTLTMVTYTITISCSLIFAAKKKYEIDANQELFALSPLSRIGQVVKVLDACIFFATEGTSNIFASFFSCAPVCCSLSRSYVQFAAGSHTMITSLVSAIGVLCVILFIGPLFEKLPRCVLSSIVVVSLKALIMQIVDLKKLAYTHFNIMDRHFYHFNKYSLALDTINLRFYKLSSLDAAVWLITFLSTTIINIDIGLGAGLIASVGALFIRSQKSYTCLLGRVMETELYMDIERYATAEEIPTVKIFHYCGGLNFATKNSFRSSLLRKVGYLGPDNHWDPEFSERIKCVIVDATALSYVDGPGIKILLSVKKQLAKNNVATLLAGPNGPVMEMIGRFNSLKGDQLQLMTFPTVHDAVVYYNNVVSKSNPNLNRLMTASDFKLASSARNDEDL